MTDTSTALMLVRTAFSLGVILAMIWGASRVVRRRGRVSSRQPTAIEVSARRAVGRRANLLVVEIGGRTLLVGATDTSVGLVADVTVSTDRPLDLDDDGPDDASLEIIELPVESLDLTSTLDLASPDAPTSFLGSLRSLTARRI